MSNITTHAHRELAAIGYDINDKEEGPNKWIVANLLELLEVFANQEHSGFSAPYCISLFTKLASFEPLCPLTGADDEWHDISDMQGGIAGWQNIRCSRIFKDGDGRAYDINGRVFRTPDGGCYTSCDSKIYVTFPYTPTVEYIDVPGEG